MRISDSYDAAHKSSFLYLGFNGGGDVFLLVYSIAKPKELKRTVTTE
jgi:hypothetical protein